MTQRAALAITAAVTAFVLVLAYGVTATLAKRTTEVGPPAAEAGAPPAATATPASPEPTRPGVSPDLATSIARALRPNARLAGAPELVDYQGTVAYEVGFLDGSKVYVDAQGGQIVDSVVAGAPAPVGAAARTRSGDSREHGDREGHGLFGRYERGGDDDD